MTFDMMSETLKLNLQDAKTKVLPKVMSSPLIGIDLKDYETDIGRCLSNYRAENLSEAEIDSKILAEIEKFRSGSIEEVPDYVDSNSDDQESSKRQKTSTRDRGRGRGRGRGRAKVT